MRSPRPASRARLASRGSLQARSATSSRHGAGLETPARAQVPAQRAVVASFLDGRRREVRVGVQHPVEPGGAGVPGADDEEIVARPPPRGRHPVSAPSSAALSSPRERVCAVSGAVQRPNAMAGGMAGAGHRDGGPSEAAPGQGLGETRRGARDVIGFVAPSTESGPEVAGRSGCGKTCAQTLPQLAKQHYVNMIGRQRAIAFFGPQRHGGTDVG